MTNFDNAIEKLLRRIERATNKNKLKKVQRLTTQLDLLLKLQDQIEQQEDSVENVADVPSSTLADGAVEVEESSGTDSSTNIVHDNESNPTLDALEREDIQYEEEREEEEEEENSSDSE